MQLSGSFYALAIFCASALGAALSPQDRLVIKVYGQTEYHGTPHSVPFRETACTRLPSVKFLSIRIPENYDCFFYGNRNCVGDPAIDAFDSIPDVRDYTDAPLHSFHCDATE